MWPKRMTRSKPVPPASESTGAAPIGNRWKAIYPSLQIENHAKGTQAKSKIDGGNILEPKELADVIVEAIAERLGSDIVLLDMQEVTLLADYFVICSAESTPQFRAILDEVETQVKAAGGRRLHVEGEAESGWILLDYNHVVVHIFDPELRAYYNLEELWKEARLVVRIQ
jgi:ribosome-associated protein